MISGIARHKSAGRRWTVRLAQALVGTVALATVAACTGPAAPAAAPVTTTVTAVSTQVLTAPDEAASTGGVTVPVFTPAPVPDATATTAAGSEPAGTEPVTASTDTASTDTASTDTASTATAAATDPTVTDPAVTTSETTPTTTAPAPMRPANLRFSLEPDEVDVDPLRTIKVKVGGGTLQTVTLTNAAGETIEGELNAEKTAWILEPELGYGKEYHLVADAVNAEGRVSTRDRTFTTVTPDNLTFPTAFPLDGDTVGVGQPIVVYFDEPIRDRKAAQAAIHIDATPKTEGAFFWINDQEVRWRPKTYWRAGTEVAVTVDIYGRDLGGGLYGQVDKEFAFTVGRSKVAVVDDATKIMVIKVDGKVVKEMPVSMGSDQYPTYSGVHVVAEKYEKKIMDSSTWGLTGTGAYRTEVEYASRISSSGEFVHAAPWSVGSQGSENVSHGCINVSTEDAKWFYDNFGPGDVVDIRNTKGADLQVWDGFGDWQVPWDQYRTGSL